MFKVDDEVMVFSYKGRVDGVVKSIEITDRSGTVDPYEVVEVEFKSPLKFIYGLPEKKTWYFNQKSELDGSEGNGKMLILLGENQVELNLGEDFIITEHHCIDKKTAEPQNPNPDYIMLEEILKEAYNQAANGKGKERHANLKPFNRQPICEIGRMVGIGYNLGQAMKKAQESQTLLKIKGKEPAVNELLGAINYLASAVILIRESE